MHCDQLRSLTVSPAAQLRTSFDANMATIVANISAMDRRFERIFDQLGMEESKDE